MCTKEAKLNINRQDLSIWKGKKGHYVYCMDGEYHYIYTSHSTTEEVARYTITTYSGIYTLSCTPDTKVLTDRGEVCISELKENDGLYVKGIHVKSKYSAVKEIEKKSLGVQKVYTLTMLDAKYVFMNDIVVVMKSRKQYGNELHQ